MGISALLPALKSIERAAHVGDAYGGAKVCVDAYVWLHRGAYACSRELCEGVKTTKHVEYFVNRARGLRRSGVEAVFVFDGGRLPGKAAEEAQRRRNRREALDKAKTHARNGNASAANECYVRAVDVTPEMAREVIEALEREGFECLTAPYEADAQMAYLVKHGFVSAVITEDSDLIAHGCKSVFTKMSPDGSGIEIRFEELGKNRGMSFVGFTPQMFLEMCVLSGCDYLPSLAGVGLKKAHSLIRRFKTYNKVLRHMKFEGISVPKDYEARFVDALLTFKYSWVYCPKRQKLVNLNDPAGVLDEKTIVDLPRLIGVCHPPELARAVATSQVHPMTFEAFARATSGKGPGRVFMQVLPVMSAPALDPDQICDEFKRREVPAGTSEPSKESAAFASFLREKPEDDAYTYKAALVHTETSKAATKTMNRSFYAALDEHENTAPSDNTRRRRNSLDSRQVANEVPTVVPDSVERPTPMQRSRLPKDISNVGGRIVAETPMAPSSVKRSPYFANAPSTSKAVTPSVRSYAAIAKDSIDRVKRSTESEFGAPPLLNKRTERTPTRTTPMRAAKQSRTTTSASRRSGKQRESGDRKFWQMSLFDTFAFDGK